MKRYIYTALLIGLLAVSQVFGAKVTNIRLSYENGAAVARVDVDGTIRFAHQTEVPKDGKPDRMILDVLGATNDLSVKEFTGLPSCTVERIRTSQYSVRPEKIARIVFDMTRAPIYSVTQEGSAIKVVFTDASAKPFLAWTAFPEAGSVKPPAPVKTESPAAKVAPSIASAPTPSTPAQQNKAAEQDRQNSLAANTPSAPVVTAPQTSPAKPPVEPKPTVASKPEASPVKVQPPSDKASEVSSTASQKTAPVIAKPDNAPAPTTVAKNEMTKPSGATSPITGDVVSKEKETKPAPATAAEPKPSPSIATSVAPIAKPSTTPVAPKPASEPSQEATQTPGSNTLSAVATGLSKSANPPEAAAKPSLDSAGNNEQTEDGLADESETTPDSLQQMADEVEAPASQDTAEYKSTARFRRSPMAQTKVKGTMVAEFPKRLLIRYEANSHRDPFAPLVDDTRTNNNPFQPRIPNVEGLRLVGIIESNTGDNRALLEDKNNYSYMLKSGDKVQKGYVLRVEDDKVYFQIFEYGWSRTIALTIYEKNGR
jgi:Tfp pilus assembly protein PilP